jgi:hypothetical protein
MKCSLGSWGWPSLGIVVALGLAASAALPAAGKGNHPGGDVEGLIRQLGDRRAKVREAATRRLLELKGAGPALRAALKSPDPEIARRAAWILDEIPRRAEERAGARLKQHGRNREVDQAVEVLVGRPKWDDERPCWQVLTSLAAELIERGRKEYADGIPVPHKGAEPSPYELLPVGEFGRYVKVARPLFLTGPRVAIPRPKKASDERSAFVIRGKEVAIVSLLRGSALIAASGSLRYDGDLMSSVTYVTGPVQVRSLWNSVLVCDGDLTVKGVRQSLVIVRGDVHCNGAGVGTSLIIASGRLHIDKHSQIAKTAKIRERQADLLGFVKFFETAQAGLEVEPAKGGVRVKTVDAKKGFAKAGLQAGDLITGVDKQATADPEGFRRQLRSALARGTFTLQVSRGDKSRQIRLPAAQP